MKKNSLVTLCLLLAGNILFAQNARFAPSGIIEFDKTVNMFAIIKKSINKDNESFLQPAFEAYKKSKPQFKVMKSTLTFSNGKTLFKPIESTEPNSGGFLGDDATTNQNNTIFTDFATSTSISQKNVFEETFLLKDSTRKINWKLTSETRDIAGYPCRRANAIILDSVYVVAFYTEKIPTPGGPESFSGLPGMILGVALPHENITWFATKVTDTPVNDNALVPPTKGKATNNKAFRATLMAALKNWGTYAQKALKAFSL